MADEITITARLKIKNNAEISRQVVASFDQSTEGFIHNVQTVGLTPEALELGDVASPGWAWFLNTDDSNFIEIGLLDSGSVFQPFMKLEAGEPGVCRLGTNAPYAKADDTASAAAPIKLEYIIGED